MKKYLIPIINSFGTLLTGVAAIMALHSYSDYRENLIYEKKLETYIQSLNALDSIISNMTHIDNGKILPIKKQNRDIGKIREAQTKLFFVTNNVEILEAYTNAAVGLNSEGRKSTDLVGQISNIRILMMNDLKSERDIKIRSDSSEFERYKKVRWIGRTVHSDKEEKLVEFKNE